MTTYTSVFGGDNVPPSEYQFRAFNLTADVTLTWPDNTDGPDLVAALMNITPSGGAWTITLPAANQVSSGRDFLMRNLGAVSFDVVDAASGALATIAAGESRYFYITSNATTAGTWSVFTYGTGTSAADASALAGLGLTVLSGTLNSKMEGTALAGDSTLDVSSRAQLLVYASGADVVYLPNPAAVPNGFYCALTNQGTGTLTLDAATNSSTLDGNTTKTIQPSESLFLTCNGVEWFSVGYGRSAEFTFTQLAVDVTGTGGITITSAQATNKLWYFYNAASGDRTVTIPAVASVYFVRVGGIGAGNELTFTTGSGASVALGANQSYTMYCDGTNVVSAQTVAVTSTVSLDDGAAPSPSLYFTLDTDTGFYRSANNVVGIAAGGSMVALFSGAGVTLAAPLSVANGGTGATTLTGLVKGAGTSAFTAATAGTDYAKPDTASSWSGVQTYINTKIRLLGSSTGYHDITSANAGASNYVLNVPAATTYIPIAAQQLTFTGPLTARTYTLPDAATTILTTNAAITVAQGGTGQTTATAAFNALSPSTTKGDLIVHNGTDDIRVGVGANDYVLVADSAQASGVKWATGIGVALLPLSVTNGGTGATSAAAAAENLGVGVTDSPTFAGINVTGNATLGDDPATDTHAIKGATTLLANSASAALTVTQTGSGNAFVVEDSASTDSTPFVIDASGTTTIGGNPPSAGKVGIVGAAAGIALAMSDNVNSSMYIRTALGGAIIGTDAGGNLHLAAGGNTTAECVLSVSSAQSVGIGVTSPAAGYRFTIGGTYAGSTTTRSCLIAGTVDPTISTNSHTGNFSSIAVAAGTLPALYYNYVSQGAFTGSVTLQAGYVAESTLTGATNNYGFYGNIASGTGRWNFYAAGTAANYFGGVTTFAKAIIEAKTAPTISTNTLTLDLTTSSLFAVSLNANITTLTLSNPPTTGLLSSFILEFTADGTGRTVTWPAAVKWAGGTGPTLTSTNGKKDAFIFYTYDAGTTYIASIIGQAF